jgi:hypothetical protein
MVARKAAEAERKRKEMVARKAAEADRKRKEIVARKAAEKRARQARLEEEKRQKEERRRAVAARKAAEEKARREHIARLTAGLKPTNLVAAIVNSRVKLRKLPERAAKVIGELPRGSQVEVVGVLPSGWLKVAEEGEPIGYIYKTAVAAQALAALGTAAPLAAKPPPSTGPPRPKFPRQAAKNKDGVAVIIGNRDYGKRAPAVDFAGNDADAMKWFVIEALGFREGNVIDLRDATLARLVEVFGTKEAPKGRLSDWTRPGKSDIVVFYSGHGVPGLGDRRGYLLPVDSNPNRAEITGYSIDLLYANLSLIDAKSITVFLDTCFSGETPRGMLIRLASGISVTPKLPSRATGLTVLTAAQGDQVASWDEDAKLGLFTKHLLEALYGAADASEYGDGDGRVTVAEVKKYLDEEMTYQARRRFGRQQNATVQGDGGWVLAKVPPQTPETSAGAKSR